jgi:pyruvate,water dikinase
MPLDAVLAETPTVSTLVALDAALDAATCGHKAASLSSLRRLGFDVPDGFVIPVGAEPTRAEVARALERIGVGPVAVRSSGVAEDLADASLAGQYQTVLNIEGVDAVMAAAAACVESAWSAHVREYSQSSGAMAVLVQQMVNADVSGVAFSANPLTDNCAEVRISATRGLGDRLVSGEVDADEWIVRGGHASALATPQGAVAADLVSRVADLARKAEAARQTPQDIEWAARGDQLFLLQSRPITVLPVAPAIDPPKGAWTKDSAHFAEPLSPFAVSTQMKHADTFLDEAIATWGLLPDGIRFRV